MQASDSLYTRREHQLFYLIFPLFLCEFCDMKHRTGLLKIALFQVYILIGIDNKHKINACGLIITLQNDNTRYLRFPWHADIGISPNALLAWRQ